MDEFYAAGMKINAGVAVGTYISVFHVVLIGQPILASCARSVVPAGLQVDFQTAITVAFLRYL